MTDGQPDLENRFLGCLIGCAVGDALGAPFEGYWDHQLPDREGLLQEFREVEGYPRGQYTDDTQLTIATIKAIVRQKDAEPSAIAHAIARLWRRQEVVGPGGSCTFAAHAFLKSGDWTTCGEPIGQAGNGTAMRTAALGLFYLNDPDRLPAAVADVSRITHQDPRSIAGGVAIVKAAQLLATLDTIDARPFCAAIAETTGTYNDSIAALIAELPTRLQEDRETALHAIAWAGSPRPEFSRPIITLYVVPTVLASLWAVLNHPTSWPDAVADAILLGGDVDTLGAIVGALMGTRLGLESIPIHLTQSVLQSHAIQRLARQYYYLVTDVNPSM